MRKIALLLFIIVLGACTSSGKKQTGKKYYRFPEHNITPTTDLQVYVKRPSAMGILGNRPMVVQTNDGSLIQMNNNFWLESPKTLLHNYLQEAFVNDPEHVDYTLNSQILMLEKKQDQALLSIKFTLTDLEHKLVFSKTYKKNRPLTENNIPAFVKSITILLEEITQEMIQDIQ